jgi:hypothetical protein
MTRFLVYALIFLSDIVLVSCAVDQGSSALLDNFDPDHFQVSGVWLKITENHS